MKTLNDTFEIEDVKVVTGDLITQTGDVLLPELKSIGEKIDNDYEVTRSNLYNLLTQGQEALAYALEVAKQSEHPRAFEVVGNLMKQLAEVNYQLLDLSEKRLKLSSNDGTSNASTINNNAFFVGSTKDLNVMLQNLTKKE
jgi:hypothetical protein